MEAAVITVCASIASALGAMRRRIEIKSKNHTHRTLSGC